VPHFLALVIIPGGIAARGRATIPVDGLGSS
jgi:hypothetical protein